MIPALSAIGGSLIGALSSVMSTWMVQRHRERREIVAQKTAHLEQLYSDFINESARLLIDAVQHSLEEPGTLVPIYALVSRIRLRSSTDVIASGERLIATILKVYFEPNLTPDRHSSRRPLGDGRIGVPHAIEPEERIGSLQTQRRYSLRMLCVVHTSDHSPCTFSNPRNRNCRKPRACLICPITGSTIPLRAA